MFFFSMKLDIFLLDKNKMSLKINIYISDLQLKKSMKFHLQGIRAMPFFVC